MSKLFGVVLTIFGVIAVYAVFISLYLPVYDPLQQADAIVAVSGGDTKGRTKHAVDLYKEGYSPRLIFSGAAADPDSASNAKVMLAIAASRGVPTSDISLDENARNARVSACPKKPRYDR